MFHCYILYSPSLNKFYIGHTGDSLTNRLRKHNSNHKGFTGQKADWSIVHKEMFDNKDQALAREKEIKAWKSRVMIQKLLERYTKNLKHPDL